MAPCETFVPRRKWKGLRIGTNARSYIKIFVSYTKVIKIKHYFDEYTILLEFLDNVNILALDLTLWYRF